MTARPLGLDDPIVIETLGAYVKLLRAGRSVLAQVEPQLAAAGLTPAQFGVQRAILHSRKLNQRR